MKKIIAITVTVIISMIFCLVGCTKDVQRDISDTNGDGSSKSSGEVNHVNSDSSQVIIEKPSDITTEEYGEFYYLTEKTADNAISVKVPVHNSKEVNAVIYNYISENLTQILSSSGGDIKVSKSLISLNDQEYSKYFIELDYTLSLKTDSFISIVFQGLMNYKNAAHPVHLFLSVNIDVEEAAVVEYTDIYRVNTELYKTFIKYADKKLEDMTANASAEAVFSEEIFLNGLQNKTSVRVYYTPSSVGFSYEVGHALGDHIEVEIPYSEMEQYKIQF